jgi:23S rRNA (guanosine2251-2'-O)-methyltransferase
MGKEPAPELIFGLHPVLEALRAGRRRLVRLRIQEDLKRAELGELTELALAAGIRVERIPRSRLEATLPPGAKTQGLVLEAGPLPAPSLEELRSLPFSPGESRRLVALDGVEDPQNLGAIIRVAEAAGALGLVLTARRAPPLGAAVARASAGAVEHLPVSRVGNLRRALEQLKKGGFWAIGADASAGEDLFQTSDQIWQGDLVLVFGAEGRGLRRGVVESLDHRIRIPTAGRLGSLNVASAAAVVLFEILRRDSVNGGKTHRIRSR